MNEQLNNQEINIYKDQQGIIGDLTDIIKLQHEQNKMQVQQNKEDRLIYIKYIKRVTVGIIVGLFLLFALCICTFYYLYFTTDISNEIRERNTYTTNNNTTNRDIKENYNYNENK